MSDVERSILATLTYYSAFRRPLTASELAWRLIPPKRLGGSSARPSLGEIMACLDALKVSGLIAEQYGFYGMRDAVDGDHRIEQEKECAQKWRHMRRYAWWLQGVPFVRALLASGSLALGTTGPDSDWDMFIIAQKGRLYTARAGLLMTAWLMRRLRTKRDRIAPDTFCFNHYVTTSSLAIRHRSLFVAHGLASLIPICDPHNYLSRLWQANHWREDYVVGVGGTEYVRRSVALSRFLHTFQYSAELILRSPLGSLIERVLRTLQYGRIHRDPAMHAKGGRIVADDHEIEFHPRSFEAVALQHYNQALAWLIPGLSVERDSGLTH